MFRRIDFAYAARKLRGTLRSGHSAARYRQMLERLADGALGAAPGADLPAIDICVAPSVSSATHQFAKQLADEHQTVNLVGGANEVTAPWIWYWRHDLKPTKHCIAALHRAIAQHPETALLFSDEWIVDADGQTTDLWAKPAMDVFAQANGTLWPTSFVQRVGVTTQPARAASWVHLPYPLTQRPLKPDTATSVPPKGTEARPSDPVTIVIPSRNAVELVDTCLTSLFETTRYPIFDVVVVDNGSDDGAVFELYRRVQKLHQNFRVISSPGEFNFAALVNEGAACAQGHVCLLNNDIEIVQADWLTQMVGALTEPAADIGVVGARLNYPDGSIQHLGVGVGLFEAADHPYRADRSPPAIQASRLAGLYEVSAVTAAAMLVHSDCWRALKGFDGQTFVVAFNDVDFCLRARAAGWRIALQGGVELVHHESASRGKNVSRERQLAYAGERAALQRRWQTRTAQDPFLSPHHCPYSRTPRLTSLDAYPEARTAKPLEAQDI
ncbi:MAG: glycosyltransferase family 2 protein [Pseudomonadota bacterium]